MSSAGSIMFFSNEEDGLQECILETLYLATGDEHSDEVAMWGNGVKLSSKMKNLIRSIIMHDIGAKCKYQ